MDFIVSSSSETTEGQEVNSTSREREPGAGRAKYEQRWTQFQVCTSLTLPEVLGKGVLGLFRKYVGAFGDVSLVHARTPSVPG